MRASCPAYSVHPDQGGGPGSIWRIDGTTGEVRLFANVMLDGAANSGPALGGLAFDARSNSCSLLIDHRYDSPLRPERGRHRPL